MTFNLCLWISLFFTHWSLYYFQLLSHIIHKQLKADSPELVSVWEIWSVVCFSNRTASGCPGAATGASAEWDVPVAGSLEQLFPGKRSIRICNKFFSANFMLFSVNTNDTNFDTNLGVNTNANFSKSQL